MIFLASNYANRAALESAVRNSVGSNEVDNRVHSIEGTLAQLTSLGLNFSTTVYGIPCVAIGTSIPIPYQTTFIVPGMGQTFNFSNREFKDFAICVKGGATRWIVNLEGSLDNVNFSPILTHSERVGEGQTLWTGGTTYACSYLRIHTKELVLGAAPNIVVMLLAQ